MESKHYSANVLNWNVACDQQSAIDNVDGTWYVFDRNKVQLKN